MKTPLRNIDLWSFSPLDKLCNNYMIPKLIAFSNILSILRVLFCQIWLLSLVLTYRTQSPLDQ